MPYTSARKSVANPWPYIGPWLTPPPEMKPLRPVCAVMNSRHFCTFLPYLPRSGRLPWLMNARPANPVMPAWLE